jgi:hypothetical protein
VRVDVIGEGKHELRVTIVPLQGDLGLDAVLVALHEDRFLVDDGLVLVQMLNKGSDAAVVLELVALAVAFVLNRDDDAAVQEGELAKSLRQGVETVVGRLEDLSVGLERDLRSPPLRSPGDFELSERCSALVALLIHLSVAPDLEIQSFGQRVDDRNADPVETTRNFVAVVVELAAGVQHGQHHFGGGFAAFVPIDRNSPPVVDNGDRPVYVDGDVDLVTVAGQRLINGVVDNLIYEMVKARCAGRTDVHRRTLPHRLEALEDLDLVGAVVIGGSIAVGAARGGIGRR